MFQVSNKHSDNQIKTDHTHQYGIVNHTDSPKKKNKYFILQKIYGIICMQVYFFQNNNLLCSLLYCDLN